MLDEYERHLERAAKSSSLPDNPDLEKVGAFMEYVNRRVIEGAF